MTVTVYEKPNCQACTATKRRLGARGIEFETADITDAGNLSAAKALGFQEAPVVIVGDGMTDETAWSGFRPDLIDLIGVSE